MPRLSRRHAALALGSAGAILTAWARVFDRLEVVGDSMEPTLSSGDRVLCVRRWRQVRPGDLVVVDDPEGSGRRLVKRVAVVRGHLVDLRGDNPAASTDSRTFGPVDTEQVHQLVVRRYWSPHEP